MGKRYTKHLDNWSIEGGCIETNLGYNPQTGSIGVGNVHRYYSGYTGGQDNNPKCATYLGIHIAEKILSNLFINTEMMPNGNPGYDFTCGKGYKIDCKSSTIRNDSYWSFNITRNIITDYFLCLAFDNRDSLTPLHVWLIPGHLVSHLTGLSISKSTTWKWSKYEQPLDQVLKCCDVMR
jgi:hypothetical protein